MSKTKEHHHDEIEEGMINMLGTCKKCGCNDGTACQHPDHGPCWWIEDDLCSHCGIVEIADDPATEHPTTGHAEALEA